MFKYYTVETLAMSIDPNHDYTPQEIEYLYKDYFVMYLKDIVIDGHI